jgi:hypothetical protein
MSTRNRQKRPISVTLISWTIAFAATVGLAELFDLPVWGIALTGLSLGLVMGVLVSLIYDHRQSARLAQQERQTDELLGLGIDRLRALGAEQGAALADEIERGRARRKSG